LKISLTTAAAERCRHASVFGKPFAMSGLQQDSGTQDTSVSSIIGCEWWFMAGDTGAEFRYRC